MIAQLTSISNEFRSQLDDLEADGHKMTVMADSGVILCRKTLHRLKGFLIENKFATIEEEIEFFKNIKQISAIPLIYYSEVLSFELQFPMANAVTQKKYINKKISRLNRFFRQNIDFVQYIERNHSHFDSQYFTREFADSYHIVSSKFYFQDPDFTTARDLLLGKVHAYRKLVLYLKNRLPTKENSSRLLKHTIEPTLPKLRWTSSKAALTELVYALYASGGLNNGNVEIKEIAVALQRVFQFDLGDFYKIYAEIKFRKNSRTKFLDTLSTGLIALMDNSEI